MIAAKTTIGIDLFCFKIPSLQTRAGQHSFPPQRLVSFLLNSLVFDPFRKPKNCNFE